MPHRLEYRHTVSETTAAMATRNFMSIHNRSVTRCGEPVMYLVESRGSDVPEQEQAGLQVLSTAADVR